MNKTESMELNAVKMSYNAVITAMKKLIGIIIKSLPNFTMHKEELEHLLNACENFTIQVSAMSNEIVEH